MLENGLVARAEQAEQAKQAEQGKQAKQFYPGGLGGGVNPLAFGGPGIGGGFGPGFNQFGNGLGGGGGSATQWSNDQSFAANSKHPQSLYPAASEHQSNMGFLQTTSNSPTSTGRTLSCLAMAALAVEFLASSAVETSGSASASG